MKIFVFLVPIVLFLVMLAIKILAPDYYSSLVQEDALVENMQFWFYLTASILASLVSIRFLRNKIFVHGILYGVLAGGLLLISLDEISWGQRIFNITSPDYFRTHNAQDEITLHNLYPVQRNLHACYILVGAYGAFAWLFMPLIPSKAKSKVHQVLNFVVADWFLSSYFFFAFLIYVLLYHVIRQHLGDFLVEKDQEPAELFLSLGFLAFAATNYVRVRIHLTTPSGKRIQ